MKIARFIIKACMCCIYAQCVLANDGEYLKVVDNVRLQKILKESNSLIVILQKLGLNNSFKNFDGSIRNSLLRLRISNDEWLFFKCDPDSLIVKGEVVRSILSGDEIADLLPSLNRASDVKVLAVEIKKVVQEK